MITVQLIPLYSSNLQISHNDFQHILGSVAECQATEMTFSTFQCEAIALGRKKLRCLWVAQGLRLQIEKLKYLGVLFHK